MIQLQTLPRQAPAWQHELRHAFSRPAELLRFLELDPALPQLRAERLRQFPLRVPRGFAARMQRGNPRDPLFLQVWPWPDEDAEVPGYTLDAVGDLAMRKDGGMLHKYQGRVLLIATGACGLHCRYCFRRHFPYSESLATRDHWQEALAQIRADPSIREVILSGGDPLSLADEKLEALIAELDTIGHLRRLRLHTRQPVVLPERVDERLLRWLTRTRLQKVIVLHANHAQELDRSVADACAALRASGAQLLNQAVLLRGVNDTLAAQQDLSERLSECGVLPYYLHMLDRVHGSAHFEVEETAAQALMRAMSEVLPGYLLPRLAREVAGRPAKEIVAW
jgi:EF-P beta-lysylation protein EpmB